MIFIEIALGLDNLALLHFTGNALLRTYQLLVSPSVVSYLIRDQFYNFIPLEEKKNHWLSKRIRNSLYVLSLNEFHVENIQSAFLWRPLRALGKSLDFLNLNRVYLIFLPLYSAGTVIYVFKESVAPEIINSIPNLFAFFGFVFVLKSFSERKTPFLAWTLIVLSHFWIAMAILFNEKVTASELIMYLSGITISGIIGYISLLQLKKLEKRILINQYLGHAYDHPIFALFFLIAALGVTGFPITSTFIGEDLLFSHIESNQYLLAFLISSCFVVSGIAGIRVYARLFLGPHVKTNHELPYKSA